MADGPTARGLIESVRSLRGPLGFDAVEPVHRGLRYRARTSPRHRAPRVDVYLPPGHGPWPSVVLVHGGGFLIGSRQMKPIRYLSTHLTQAGFAVAAVDYRLVGRGGRLHRAVEDVAWTGGCATLRASAWTASAPR